MNGQDLAAGDITDWVPDIDIGAAEAWWVGSDRGACVLDMTHGFTEKGTESLRRRNKDRLSCRRNRPPQGKAGSSAVPPAAQD